jgi:hypothetical protein
MPSSSTGGNFPAKIAHEIFKFAYAGRSASNFIKPDDVQLVNLDKKSYNEFHKIVLAGEYTPEEYVYREYFKNFNVPTEKTEYWDKPMQVTQLSVNLNNDNKPIVTFVAPQKHIEYMIVRHGDNDPQPVHLTTLSGETGNCMFVDESASIGVQRYAVIPYHPEIMVDGQYLQGDISAYVEVEVPFFGKPENPWWLPFKPKPTPTPEITPAPEPTPTESLFFPQTPEP